MDFATIKSTLARRESQELRAIWIEHDTETWTPDAFRATADILRERGESLPDIGGSAADTIRIERAAAKQRCIAERRQKLGSALLHTIAFVGALPTALVSGLLLAGLAQVVPLPEKWRVEFATFGTISIFLVAWNVYFRLLARRFLA